MSVPKEVGKTFPQEAEDAEYINPSSHFEELDPEYYSYQCGHLSENLSKSDYAKVIFCDLYYNLDSTVGCRFQITDNVHEDPADCIGIYRVGYDNLSQCLASKLLSQTVGEEDGKLLRCTFKPSELPHLENGFYQFLYVTRDNEVCGASMPFHIKSPISKDLFSEEDIVADNSEDDFLLVRSNMAEKNRRLQALLDEMTEKCLKHESDMRLVHDKFKVYGEEKKKFEYLLKQASDEKMDHLTEVRKMREEKNSISVEKEEAVRILKEKNKVFSAMFEDYTEKLKEFSDLKDVLLKDKSRAEAENLKLQGEIKKLSEDLQNKQSILDSEKERKLTLTTTWKKESSLLVSKLTDAKLMISALEKNKQLKSDELTSLNKTLSRLQVQLKDAKCENFVLHRKLFDSTLALDKKQDEIQNMMSEIAALKFHILQLHEAQSSPGFKELNAFLTGSSPEIPDEKKPGENEELQKLKTLCAELQAKLEKYEAPLKEKKSEEDEELRNLKIQCAESQAKLEEKNNSILKLKEEIVKVNGVVDYLTKEKESVQKNGSLLHDALNECILRLNEGSELYKRQYKKIEKLKRKLKNNKAFMDKSCSSASVKDSCDSSDETVCIPEEDSTHSSSVQSQNSDSDTGEHVVPPPSKTENNESYELSAVEELLCQALPLSIPVETELISPKIKQVPELQKLIEKNLENFKKSQSKNGEDDDDDMYTIPCPICDEEINAYMSTTEEMVEHLELEHRQQVCPVCGRLFDMNLPPKYFVFHVEDHFVKENKK